MSHVADECTIIELQLWVMVKNVIVLHHYSSAAKNLAEHRYMCIEDETTHRRVGILQADQAITGSI